MTIFSNVMGYVGFQGNKMMYQLSRAILLCLVPFTLMMWNKFPMTQLMKRCFFLMTFQLLSIFGAVLIHGQGFADTFIVSSYALVFLSYPLLYVLKIDDRDLVKMMIVIGVLWTAVMIIQQFTYPTYWFGGNVEDGVEVSQRNGIYRFSIFGTTYGLLSLFYGFQNFLETNKQKYLLLVFIGIVGVYLTCTRQIMAASLGCVFVGLYLSRKIKLGAFIAVAISGILIYLYADLLFSEYIEMTEEIDEEYIRFISYRFYGIDYNKNHPLAVFIGNGLYREGSAYGSEMMQYREELGLYQSDIGLVGEYSLHGIFAVITILSIFWYVFKNRKYIDLYLLLFMLYSFLTSIMLMPFRCSLTTFSTIVALYMIDCSIARNKRAMRLAYIRKHNSENVVIKT